ncbi:MAG: glucosidase [Phycisphaerae bacterium]|nr:glucosidase [Phycisphaerae bacterium]
MKGPAAAPASAVLTAEEVRLAESEKRTKNWKRWGPYLSERQWGTVREDYSADGDCWNYFPHDHARSRAYRWGEDGLLGIADRECRLCFALALWNERDPILKERLFGLTGPEGNHGEDVKEHYFYLDSTPTHSYMKALYKYPHAEFPYARLVGENRRRGRGDRELELADTGAFDESRYFDVQAEYAKASPDDLCIRITVINRGPERATCHVLPTFWCRNTWAWGFRHEGCEPLSHMAADGSERIIADQHSLGRVILHVAPGPDGKRAPILFTDNETNTQRLWNAPSASRYVKDAFHDYLIHGRTDAVNPERFGTKAAPHFRLELKPGESVVLRLRLVGGEEAVGDPFDRSFDDTFDARLREADEFFATRGLAALDPDRAAVTRQAYAGLLWSKQFYHYSVRHWLDGDSTQPAPPESRKTGRNSDWGHLFHRDVLSMPDKWEYPWYAAWDLAFHMIPFANVDPHFAKEQLILLLREWYMHPSGQIPAYEFALGDVNPPVHAWACWRVYKMSGPKGSRDHNFLARVFQKLLINFTWWVNRKDPSGKHLFAGGFLGLDNIGVFDRSRPLPTGGHLEQADGTAWMAFYCGTMLSMALELARVDPTYEDVASKFFEHFVAITDAMNTLGGTGLWDEADGFYYDQISVDGRTIPLRLRSLVGIIPILAVEVLEEGLISRLPAFKKRMEWFIHHRPDLARHISYMQEDVERSEHPGHEHRLLAIPSRERLERVLRYLFDESEFLAPYGVRSLSKKYESEPYVFEACGERYSVRYVPGESDSGLFGGNSNWRGPIWFPLNFLIIEALERYHHFFGDSLTVELPTGSGRRVTLAQAADELRARLTRLFLRDAAGVRPCVAPEAQFATDPHWKHLVLFHEHFHPETGRGLGASHQTGWTALVANMLTPRSRWRV